MKIQPLVMCLLALCCIAAHLFFGAHPTTLYAQSSGPTLMIPTGIQAGSPGTAVVPIAFQHDQNGIAALTFSLTYDSTCLAIESVDAAEAVSFRLPPQMRGSFFYDEDDSDGQLDFAIADYAPPFTTLPDTSRLLEVTFTVVCAPTAGTTITTPVTFSEGPPPSFSNTLGRTVVGSTVSGSVVIQDGPLPTPTNPDGDPPPGETPEPVNTAPIAEDDAVTTREFRAIKIDVLANDVDPDNDSLTITEVTQGGFGEVSIQPDGTVVYTPEPGRNGTDLFAYTISDGRGGLSEGLVTVTVTDVNVPPTARDDNATTLRNREVTIDILANDFDVDASEDGQELAIVVLGQPAHGNAQLNDDNTVLYDPTPGYVGLDEFWYTVLDGEGGTGVAKVTITVSPFNLAPELDLTTETTFEPGTRVNLQVLATDADGDTLHYTATGLPPGISIDPDTGIIGGTIAAGAGGTYRVTVEVSDGQTTTSITFDLFVTVPRVVEPGELYFPWLAP